jgi:hypothetical protein
LFQVAGVIYPNGVAMGYLQLRTDRHEIVVTRLHLTGLVPEVRDLRKDRQLLPGFVVHMDYVSMNELLAAA